MTIRRARERAEFALRLRLSGLGLGVGAKLLGAAEDEARAEGAAAMLLHAQLRAERFYASNGYVAEGDVFIDAGIEHVAMRKALG